MLDCQLFQLLRPSARKTKLKGEAYIQAQVVDFLKGASLCGELKGVWFHIPNGIADSKHAFFGRTLKDIGKIAGAPDLCFVWQHGALFIEMKTTKGQLSNEQKLFKEWCTSQSVPYELARSLHEAKAILIKHNILNVKSS